MRILLVLSILAAGSAASAQDRAVATLRREHVDAAKLAGLPASATLDEVIAALADPWTRRLAPAAARAFVADVSEQTTVGVGLPELLAIDLDPSGRYPMVVTPLPGSPAARAGVLPMDRLVAIDGVAVDGLGWSEIMRRLRGEAGSRVSLRFGRGEQTRSLTLQRRTLAPRPSVRARRSGGVLQLVIERFGAATAVEVRRALAAAPDAPVVIDLRRNPGGDLAASLDVAGALGGAGTLAQLVGPAGPAPLRSTGTRVASGRLAVIVDEGTASAAELLATGLAALRHATILGAPTRGKCLVHNMVATGDGGMVLYTTGRVARLDGSSLCRGGVLLDVTVAPGPGDPALVAATRLVAVGVPAPGDGRAAPRSVERR